MADFDVRSTGTPDILNTTYTSTTDIAGGGNTIQSNSCSVVGSGVDQATLAADSKKNLEAGMQEVCGRDSKPEVVLSGKSPDGDAPLKVIGEDRRTCQVSSALFKCVPLDGAERGVRSAGGPAVPAADSANLINQIETLAADRADQMITLKAGALRDATSYGDKRDALMAATGSVTTKPEAAPVESQGGAAWPRELDIIIPIP